MILPTVWVTSRTTIIFSQLKIFRTCSFPQPSAHFSHSFTFPNWVKPRNWNNRFKYFLGNMNRIILPYLWIQYQSPPTQLCSSVLIYQLIIIKFEIKWVNERWVWLIFDSHDVNFSSLKTPPVPYKMKSATSCGENAATITTTFIFAVISLPINGTEMTTDLKYFKFNKSFKFS